MKKFKEGDLVTHVTNEVYKMVVIYVGDNSYQCTWIDRNGKYRAEYFYEFELQELEK